MLTSYFDLDCQDFAGGVEIDNSNKPTGGPEGSSSGMWIRQGACMWCSLSVANLPLNLNIRAHAVSGAP
jgi:hypothetical protein